MLNRIELIGRLGADPESRSTPNGHKYARFSLPLFHGFNNQSDKTSWVTCEAWNKLGELIQDRAKKGMLVWVEGELAIDNWEAEGERRSRTYLRINGVRFLERTDAPAATAQSQTQTQTQRPASAASEQEQTYNAPTPTDDDYPGEEEVGNMDELFDGFNFNE
jgi:single-strand DNA-binding protein